MTRGVAQGLFHAGAGGVPVLPGQVDQGPVVVDGRRVGAQPQGPLQVRRYERLDCAEVQHGAAAGGVDRDGRRRLQAEEALTRGV